MGDVGEGEMEIFLSIQNISIRAQVKLLPAGVSYLHSQ